jgi:hypothetical protein
MFGMPTVKYLLLIHGDAREEATESEWGAFFDAAKKSGIFEGGSELGRRDIVCNSPTINSPTKIAGFMRFKSDSRQQLDDLLAAHPVVVHGGTVELYELSET